MPIRASYPIGMPCWIDCITADLDTTRTFYGALFGWTFESEGPGYAIIRRGDDVVGGLGAAPAGRGDTAFWTTYLASKNVDLTAAAVREYGGRVVMPVVAAGENGRLFLAVDPAGASVGFWQGNRAGGIVLTDEEGAMTWHELRTSSAAILSFYARLFPVTAAPVGESVIVTLDGTPGFAIHEGVAVPRWIPYFGVHSATEASERAIELGATPVDASTDAKSLLLEDPAGAVFGVRALR